MAMSKLEPGLSGQDWGLLRRESELTGRGAAGIQSSILWREALETLCPVDELASLDEARSLILTLVDAHLAEQRCIPEPIVTRPPWLDDATLQVLQVDAETEQLNSMRRRNKSNSTPGDKAHEILSGARVQEWLHSQTGLDYTLNVATYAYYQPGDSLALHVDTNTFGSVTLLVCLQTVQVDSTGPVPSNSLVLVTPDGVAWPSDFTTGRCVVFDGTATLHGRTSLRAGESSAIIVAGYGER